MRVNADRGIMIHFKRQLGSHSPRPSNQLANNWLMFNLKNTHTERHHFKWHTIPVKIQKCSCLEF